LLSLPPGVPPRDLRQPPAEPGEALPHDLGDQLAHAPEVRVDRLRRQANLGRQATGLQVLRTAGGQEPERGL
jgi:hypothetical protein